MWHVFADVKTAGELNLPTPGLRPYRAQDGTEKAGPRTVVVAPSAEMSAYLGELAARAEAVRSRSVTPEEDNMLKISSDGRKAVLDMRLIHGGRATGECKLERAARVIARVWRENRERTLLDRDSGQPSPVPGAVQIVFCDISTPVGEGWSAYRELRELLIAEGMPASRPTGGQREGRILRQGNQFRELGGVEVYRYVVERSFDAYMWQTVERKAKFIAQITRRRDIAAIDAAIAIRKDTPPSDRVRRHRRGAVAPQCRTALMTAGTRTPTGTRATIFTHGRASKESS